MGASKVLIISLLLLVIYSGISFADSSSCSSLPSNPNALTLSTSPLFSVIALAFMLSFLVIAIGVIINRVVPGTKLNEWLKDEYWEMAKSAILIAGAISILVFAGNISLLLIGQQATGSYTLSGLNQILNTLSSSSGYALCSIYGDINDFEGGSPLGIATGISTWKTINVGYWLPIPIPGVGAFTFGSKFLLYNNPMLESVSAGQFESIVNDIINFLYFPISSLIAFMYITMPLIIYIGIMVFVPLGIIFRAFPFLRPIGGTLFAFGVGLSIVFPLLIILINEPLTTILCNTLSQSPSCNTSSQSTTTGNAVLNGILNVLLALLAGTYNLYPALPLTISIYPALNIYAPYFMFLFAEFLLLLIDLMIWYPLVDSIAKSLGGTIRLELGGRLRIG